MKNYNVDRYELLLVLSVILFFNSNIIAQSKNCNNNGFTFFVAADTHFDPPPETDQYFHILAMNSVCGTLPNKEALIWPEKISGKMTNFGSIEEEINIPLGLIMAGDITDRAEPNTLELFMRRYQKGEGNKVVNFPVYVGLGNHDMDPQHVGDSAEAYRHSMLNYVDKRHKGSNAPVPVDNYDDKSRNYSWDWKNVHFIQTHRFAGNIENGMPNSIEWLKKDLKQSASDNKPIVIIQHYGFDEWSKGWYKEGELDSLYSAIKDYNIIAIFVGHNHLAENLTWKGINIFQVNNAWPDGDGNGSFSICKITDNYMDVVTCRWINGKGDVELVAPYFHKEF